MLHCIQLEGSPSSLYCFCNYGELGFCLCLACSQGLVYLGPKSFKLVSNSQILILVSHAQPTEFPVASGRLLNIFMSHMLNLVLLQTRLILSKKKKRKPIYLIFLTTRGRIHLKNKQRKQNQSFKTSCFIPNFSVTK